MARIVNLLGCALPKNLLAANPANEKGYWESPLVNRLNNELLASAGMDWKAWQQLREGWSDQPDVRKLKEEALAILQSEFQNAGLLVLKDPRMCRLIGFWREVLEAFDARPVVACPIRNPLEVAASLQKRNGLAPVVSHLIWLRYVLDAEFGTRGMRRTFVSYDALLKAWRPVVDRITVDLGISWPRSPGQAANEIEEFLSLAQRHHTVSAEKVAEDLALPEALRTTYAILDGWANEHERRADFKALDRIRRGLGDIPPALVPLIAAGHEQIDEARKLRKDIARLDGELKTSEQHFHETKAHLDERTHQLAQREAEANANAAQLAGIKEHLTKTARRLAESDAEANANAAQLAEVKAQLSKAVRRFALSEAEANANAAQLAEVKAQLTETARQLARSDAEANANATQLAEVRPQLTETARYLAERNAEVRAHAAELLEVRSQLAETARRIAQSDAEARANAAQLTAVRSQLAEAAAQLDQRDAEAKANVQRLQDVTSRLAETEANAQQLQEMASRRAETEAYAQQLQELRSQLAQTERQLAKRKTEVKAKDAQLREATGVSEHLKEELNSERESRSALQARLDRSEAELSRLRRKCDVARRETMRLDAELRRIHSTLAWRFQQLFNSAARLTGGVIHRFRARSTKLGEEAVRLVAASNLFDRDWYLTQYPDVAAEGVDPALHYVRHGAAEGRDPGPIFRTQWYLDTHKDVAAAGVNPLVHYLLHGKAEGREIAPSFAADSAPKPPAESEAAATEPPVAATDPLSFSLPPVAALPWVRHAGIVRKHGHISLELSGLIVGTATVLQANAENAWQAIADPARALVALCRIMGLDAGQALRCYIGDSPFDVASKLAAPSSLLACPVVFFEQSSAQIAIADIWYVNDRDLRFRFTGERAAGGQACVARFFQHDISSSGRLAMLGESVLDAGGVDFADVAPTNAFLPVLMTLAAPEGQLLSASLLPFPSLCRGGVHYGELCALGKEESYLESLQALSRSLLGEMLGGSATAPDFSVARIEIDLQGAIGSERIFSTEIREWLASVMQIKVTPANASAVADAKVREYLEESLGPVPLAHREEPPERIAARESAGALVLTLPADGVPSLHALVSRGLRIGSGRSCAVGPFIVAESSTVSPRRAVTVPPMGEELIALQPANAGIAFPIMTRLSPEPPDGSAKETAWVPLAVRLCDMRDRHLANLIMPVAPDAPGPLLRRVAREADGKAATISVLVASNRQTKDAFAGLLESLQLQTIADRIEIIAMDAAHAEGAESAETALQRFFPGRYRLLNHDGEASRNARINRASEHATGKFLLVAGAEVALHDPRTLETLRAIADDDKVASAGCVLLQADIVKKLQTAAFRSGGIFPSSPLHPGIPGTTFSEPDCFDVFPLATYPVAGNSSALFMVRADIWRTLGGFDATNVPDVGGDIEYGLRAIAKGFLHLCTSVVSAELHDRDYRSAYTEEALRSSLPAEALLNIVSSTSLVEALKA